MNTSNIYDDQQSDYDIDKDQIYMEYYADFPSKELDPHSQDSETQPEEDSFKLTNELKDLLKFTFDQFDTDNSGNKYLLSFTFEQILFSSFCIKFVQFQYSLVLFGQMSPCLTPGNIDSRELKELINLMGFEMSRQDIALLVKEIDEDDSESIEFEEFINMMTKYFVGPSCNPRSTPSSSRPKSRTFTGSSTTRSSLRSTESTSTS